MFPDCQERTLPALLSTRGGGIAAPRALQHRSGLILHRLHCRTEPRQGYRPCCSPGLRVSTGRPGLVEERNQEKVARGFGRGMRNASFSSSCAVSAAGDPKPRPHPGAPGAEEGGGCKWSGWALLCESKPQPPRE